MPRTDAPVGIRLARHAGVIMFALVSAGVFAQAPDAKESQALSDKYFCSACHANDRTMVGPGFKQIADKYRGDATASAMLEDKVKRGGQGVWGNVPMPPNPTITDDELKRVLAWILAL